MITMIPYKGREFTVDQKNDELADIIIEGRVFRCVQVPGPLSMWHCNQAWYAPTTLEALGRHFIDYWYMFIDPNRCPVDLVPGSQDGHHGGGPAPEEPEPDDDDGDGAHHSAGARPSGGSRSTKRRASKKGDK